MRRCGVTAMFHGVGGAVSGTAPTIGVGIAVARHEACSPCCTVVPSSGRIPSVRRAREVIAWRTSSSRDGIGSGVRGSGGSSSRPSGVEVEEVDHQLGARHAVDRAVVHLRDDADVAVGQALDDVELPQRAAAVERRAGDLRGHLGQLLVPAGGRRPDAADVVVEVEVGVLHPDRVVEPERHLHHPPPERRHQVEPGRDEVLDLRELVAAGHRRRIEDRRHGHVHVHARRLEVEEGGVQA